MSAFTEKRAEVQAEYAALTRTLNDRLADAGNAIAASHALPNEEPYATLLARNDELSARIAERRATHDRIVAIGERLQEISSARSELQKRHKEIGAELDPHYRTIGENAFRVFRDNPLVDQEYAEIFTPLLDAHEELKQIRADLDTVESQVSEKPFLEKMVLRGRLIVLRNRLSMRETQLERLHREAGKQISATAFMTTIGDPELDRTAGPFLDLMDESQRLEHEIAALDDERSALENELEKLGVGKRPATRLREIDEQIADSERERADALAAIARSAAGSDLVSEMSSDVQDALAVVAEAEREREETRARLERLDAALEAERLAGDVDQIETSIARKRSQIETLQKEIAELESRKDGLQARVHDAEQKRGSVENLLR
ncbi:MAG: hypothetical protein ACLFUA_09510 [Spirochaetales bacterium]